MQYRRIAQLALPLTLALGVGSALAQQTVIVAPAAPPAPQVETIPPAPIVSGQVEYWQAGHWTWTSGGWMWTAGHYVIPPQTTATWVPGQWVTQPSGGYVWVDGHWQNG